jgi:hypothetical protein
MIIINLQSDELTSKGKNINSIDRIVQHLDIYKFYQGYTYKL